MHPAECFFVERDSFFCGSIRFRRVKGPVQFSLALGKFLEKLRTDCQQIASSEPDDLIRVSEACTHHLSLVTIPLVVVVNARDRSHTGILVRRNVCSLLLFIPVIDSAYKRRDQRDACLRACYGLREAEEKG